VTGLSVDSAAFRQRAPRVQLSDDPDTATVQTVREMCRQINQAAEDPLVKQIALNAALRFRGGPFYANRPVALTDPRMRAESIWWWCKHALRFKHHGEMFEVWSAQLGDPRTKLQLLISPDVLVRMQRMEGDCAIYTMMICAMLKALGITYQVVTFAWDRTQPEIFGHVCARAVFPNGSFESLDASHGKYPGWQIPNEDILRMWVFDENGGRVKNYQRFRGLHAYRRGYAGLAQAEDIQEGGTYVPPAPSPFDTLPQDSGYPDFGGGGIYTAPAPSSSQWPAFVAQLAKAGLTLAQINAIQPGTVVSANGAILRQNPGYSVPFGGSALSITGGSGGSLLMVGALAIGAILIMSMARGR
jgi:hypothetical protein